jgi:hypothetical protein
MSHSLSKSIILVIYLFKKKLKEILVRILSVLNII